MTDAEAPGATPPSTGPGGAGELLRNAREAAGLSLEAVADQLKLAPRQVRALEEGHYALLPGRTFIRGFARTYARLLKLDPEAILRALPEGGAGNALEAPQLHPTTVTMGELPAAGNSHAPGLRWIALAALLAIIVAVAIVQYLRGAPGSNAAPAPPAASSAPPPTRAAERSTDGIPLPNPALAPAAGAADPGAASTSPDGREQAGGAGLAEVTLSLNGPSWVEIRDATGRTLISRMLTAGETQSLVGTPPLQVVVGNASQVAVRFKGALVDLNPFTRDAVARFTLQ